MEYQWFYVYPSRTTRVRIKSPFVGVTMRFLNVKSCIVAMPHSDPSYSSRLALCTLRRPKGPAVRFCLNKQIYLSLGLLGWRWGNPFEKGLFTDWNRILVSDKQKTSHRRPMSLFHWLMIACITWNSNLVPLLEGVCTSHPCRFEFSVFLVLAGIEPTTSGLTVPRSDQLS